MQHKNPKYNIALLDEADKLGCKKTINSGFRRSLDYKVTKKLSGNETPYPNTEYRKNKPWNLCLIGKMSRTKSDLERL